MGYTRYNYKPRRKKRKPESSFLLLLVIGIVIAIVIGIILGPLIFKNNNKADQGTNNTQLENEVKNEGISNENSNGESEKDDVKETASKEQDESKNNKGEATNGKNIYMIQCGYYGKKENAESALNEISSNNKFIVEDDKKFRVIAGIYPEDEANKISDELTKKEIANVKIRCEYSGDDKQESMIYEIITGFMKIINQLEDKEVKSIKTIEFKKWTKELYESEKFDKENGELKSLREHIEKLPDELDKDGAKKSLEFIYKILIKHRA